MSVFAEATTDPVASRDLRGASAGCPSQGQLLRYVLELRTDLVRFVRKAWAGSWAVQSSD